MLYYTYMHRRASDSLPFYVGKGTGRRAWIRKNRNRHWQHTAKKHGVAVEVLAHWGTEQEALDHEQLLIACFRGMGFPLTNIAEGGQPGPVTRAMPKSAEHRAKIAAAHAGKPKKKHDADTKRRRSEYMTGRKHAPETIEKIKSYHIGAKRSDETRKRISESKQNLSEETRRRMSEAAKARCTRIKLQKEKKWQSL